MPDLATGTGGQVRAEPSLNHHDGLHEKRAARFWAKTERLPDGCLRWTGARLWNGYGSCGQPGTHAKTMLAHRRAYEMVRGPIPAGLHLDHLCRRRDCVEPAHLEPVTNWENTLRGANVVGLNAQKTHCKRGHPFEGENVRVTPVGHRSCRACQRERKREARALALGFTIVGGGA